MRDARHEARGLRERVQELISDTQRLYGQASNAAPSPAWSRVVDTGDPPLLEFDRSYYEKHYREVGDAIQSEVIQVDRDVLSRVDPLCPYAFVIDERDRLLVYARSFDLRALVFGRNLPSLSGRRVAHAMLVPDTLRARAAGEIVFFGSTRVSGVIANTKSGHFRPPPTSAWLVRTVVTEIFDLAPEDVVVFFIP